ncbi:hypothetical protein RJT34_18910 [Clitoria ternatea]|uniref:Ubiquitin-like protease family profile domain-containing protein n=1 Tax=Clitoria ternatea TaxID=43366 RepID=A0AAN9IQH4_CLITE
MQTRRVSTKGSCAAPDGDDDDVNLGDYRQCDLFVDGVEEPVAIGSVYNLGPLVHHQKLPDGVSRISVVQVLKADAVVPIPTFEVRLVGQAVGHFLMWPTRLVSDSGPQVAAPSKKPEPPLDPIEQLWDISAGLRNCTIPVPWEESVFGLASEFPVYIARPDLCEVLTGNQMLNISVIQCWELFLHRLCIERGVDHTYGFLEPSLIQLRGNNKEGIQAYIQNWMHASDKTVYLAPFHRDLHWQLLVICPKDNIAACFCSLHGSPGADYMKILDGALIGYHLLRGKGTKKRLEWVFPKSYRQNGSFECGYFVMKTMLTIVQSGIVDRWTTDKSVNNGRRGCCSTGKAGEDAIVGVGELVDTAVNNGFAVDGPKLTKLGLRLNCPVCSFI